MTTNAFVQLSDIIGEISMGPFGSDIKVENFVQSGVPVLNGSNLTRVKLVEDEFKYLTDDKAKTFKKAIARKGDIVITHRGTLGQVSYIPDNSKYDWYVISQSQFRVRLREDKADPVFVAYYFHTKEGQKRLLSFKNHVGVPALAQATTNFRKLQIPLPDISSQTKIASILSSLDSKIELNNKINSELEKIIKTLYNYWFIQFDFPDKNGNPYKSSGGEMIWSEKLNRMIPAEWKFGSITNIGKIVSGSTPSKKQKEFFKKDGTPWITPNDLSENVGNKFITGGKVDVSDEGIKSASLKIMPKGTVLLSSRAPVGYMAISRTNVTTNQGFKSFVPENGYTTPYVYYILQTFIPTIINNASGSTFKEISASMLNMVNVWLPPINLVEKFTKLIEPIFNKQDLLELENDRLKNLRDWLLPLLMNGQVKVN